MKSSPIPLLDERTTKKLKLTFEPTTLDFIKDLSEFAHHHQGPLNEEGFQCILYKAVAQMPQESREDCLAHLSNLPLNYFKNLNNENKENKQNPSLYKDIQNSMVSEVVKKTSEGWVRPIITNGTAAFVGALGGPIGTVGSVVIKPALDLAIDTGSEVLKQSGSIMEKEIAKKISSSLSPRLESAYEYVSSVGNSVSNYLPFKRSAGVQINSNQTTTAPTQTLQDEDTTSSESLIFSNATTSPKPLIEVISEKYFDNELELDISTHAQLENRSRFKL